MFMNRKIAPIIFFCCASSASAQPWIEQRGSFIINWSQLNIQYTNTSTQEAVASLGKQISPQGDVIEIGSFKSHELAAWQTGVQNFQKLLKELVAEASHPGASLGRIKDLESLRPYSSNTTYKTSGFVEVLFRYDLPSLALTPKEGAEAQKSGSPGDISNLILRLPAGSKPKLALDLCFEDGRRHSTSGVQSAQWSKRLGGLWIKKEAYLPQGVNGHAALKVDVGSISDDLCAHVKANPEQKAQILSLFQAANVYWVAK